MNVLLLATVALIAYAVVNAVTSFLAAAGQAGLLRTPPHLPRRRAAQLFALRLLPTVASSVVALGLVVPSFLAFEPAHAEESVGVLLLVPALGSALLLAAGVWRGLRSWTATRRLVAGWVRTSEPLVLPGVDVPAHLIDHPFPVVCTAGILRPRVFVARQVLLRFNREELMAVTAHEMGHLSARDNLKGLLMRACPDFLALLPAGRRLEQAWSRMAEEAADDHAVDAPRRALDLAGALLKVARLVPPGAHAALPVSAFHNVDHNVEHGGDQLAERVTRLTADNTGGGAATAVGSSRSLVAVIALAAVSLALALQVDLFERVHSVTEGLVALLQ